MQTDTKAARKTLAELYRASRRLAEKQVKFPRNSGLRYAAVMLEKDVRAAYEAVYHVGGA